MAGGYSGLGHGWGSYGMKCGGNLITLGTGPDAKRSATGPFTAL